MHGSPSSRSSGKAGAIQVRARFLDDAKGAAWDPVAVGANARQAVQDSSAAAYIGELDSEPTRASVPITNDAGLVQVSPGAGAVDLTGPAAGYPDSPDRYRPSGIAELRPDRAIRRRRGRRRGRLGLPARGDAGGGDLGRLGLPEPRRRGVQVRRQPARDTGRRPGTPPSEGCGHRHRQAGRLRAGTAAAEHLRELSDEPRGEPGARPEAASRTSSSRTSSRRASIAVPVPTPRTATRRWTWFCTPSREPGRTPPRSATTSATASSARTSTGPVLGSYAITSDGDTTECMIQRYRISGGDPGPTGRGVSDQIAVAAGGDPAWNSSR